VKPKVAWKPSHQIKHKKVRARAYYHLFPRLEIAIPSSPPAYTDFNPSAVLHLSLSFSAAPLWLISFETSQILCNLNRSTPALHACCVTALPPTRLSGWKDGLRVSLRSRTRQLPTSSHSRFKYNPAALRGFAMSPPTSKRPTAAHGRTSKTSSSKRLSAYGLQKPKNVQIKDEDPDEVMATSFNPFWLVDTII